MKCKNTATCQKRPGEEKCAWGERERKLRAVHAKSGEKGQDKGQWLGLKSGRGAIKGVLGRKQNKTSRETKEKKKKTLHNGKTQDEGERLRLFKKAQKKHAKEDEEKELRAKKRQIGGGLGR